MATKARKRDSRGMGTNRCAKMDRCTKTWKGTPKCANKRCGGYKDIRK